MYKAKLVWQLFFSYLLIISISMIAASWYASDYIRRTYLEFIKRDLTTFARFIKSDIGKSQLSFEHANFDELCQRLADLSGERLTVILPNGRVVGESDVDSSKMDNHGSRPEVQEALQGRVGESLRYSHTVDKEMQYIAIPYIDGGKIKGVIRTSYPASSIEEALRSIYLTIILGAGVITLLAMMISYYFSYKISQPLRHLQQGALRFAHADFDIPIEVRGSEEFDALVEAMNRMAADLKQQFHTIRQQRNQQEAILSSMVEGVVAINKDQRIISINKAAIQWLGIKSDAIDGNTLFDLVDNEAFLHFLQEAIVSVEPIEHEIEMGVFDIRYIKAHSSALWNSDGSLSGSVIVMHDISRIRRLENMRQEFVGNVSHELKTPITSIKGFVETLVDGAVQNQEDTERFLSIILKQADRLHAIIEDLLSLSRIEQEEQEGRIPLVSADITVPIRAAVENCIRKADEKNIHFITKLGEPVYLEINSRLLEQAIMNLIDNAIKYSDEGSAITIRVEEKKYETEISIQDNGCGIPQEHFSRLFERFYRVDKARSRKMGGTGLGLAIVKHITQAHNGYVDVESEVGKGSVFRIHLPKSFSS